MSKASIMRFVAAALVVGSLGACATNQYGQPQIPTNARNAAVGAAAGAVAAKAFDGDVAKGALGGAAVGALACDFGAATC